MKRWPFVAMFILFVGLCASAAYWGMQLFKPPVRPIEVQTQVSVEVPPTAAAGLFGGRPVEVAVTSNFQLKGVVVAGNASESVAILIEDGKPEKAFRINTEVAPGVSIKEVHAKYILLSEKGVTKKVELPEPAMNQSSTANNSPLSVQDVPPPVHNDVPPPTGDAQQQPQSPQQAMTINQNALGMRHR